MHPDVLSLLFRPLRIQRSRIFCRQNRHSLTYPQTKTEVLSSPLDVLILWLEYLIRNFLFWELTQGPGGGTTLFTRGWDTSPHLLLRLGALLSHRQGGRCCGTAGPNRHFYQSHPALGVLSTRVFLSPLTSTNCLFSLNCKTNVL